MSRARWFFSLFLICLLSGPGLGAAPAEADEHSPFARLEQGVSRFTLSNGMRVVFFRREEAPVFSGQVWVKAGGVDERPGITGLAHFLEHMAFKGSQTIGTKDFTKEKPLLERFEKLVTESPDQYVALQSDEAKSILRELSEIWVDNEFGSIYEQSGGQGLNAMTSKDFTAYMVSLPSVAFELWCWMESERLLSPVFRQFYREREVIQEERRMNYDDSPNGKMYELLLETAYTAHPYRMPNIGYSQDLRALTETQMRTFYKTYYHPENIVLSIVGDVEPERAHELLERYFSRVPRSSEGVPTIATVEPAQTAMREAVLRLDAEPELSLAYHKPVWPNEDDARFSVVHELLSEVRSSILRKELVREKKLAASVASYEAPGTRYPSLFLIGATPSRGVSNDRLRREIQSTLNRLARTPVPSSDLAAAKRRAKVELIDSLDSNDDLSQIFAYSELLFNDPLAPLRMYEVIERTTGEDVQRLIQEYLSEPQSTYIRIEKTS
ncbi:MAG: insulinase family protein [Deltaproteobacteria bacterium]|nr:insulinase family protein [Deltaproteobacteria bacterium]